MGLSELIEQLRADKAFMNGVSEWKTIPAKKGKYVDFPEGLFPLLAESLQKKGISQLYSHQAESWRSVRSGKNTLIVTPTASGKTMCYNLPVLQTLLEDEKARALYLFPTKALSQDQQSALNEIVLSGDIPVKICTYDGDTPGSLRMAARQSGRIIISNPDMIHSGILPNHPKWIHFFQNLRYIVVDELHAYTGVFGTHFSLLVERIKRVARFYGSDPVFICSSATIGNPTELAEKLLGGEVNLINGSGAPSGEKNIVLYNPPLIDPVQGIRRGVVLESRQLALKLLKAGTKTIVFARSRINSELISSYINKSLANFYNSNQRIKVESYRGGYLPKERRAIEKGLRDGSIHGVVSTNALELGIDIGGLDASIMAGFPGSISSVWQQAGRAGRSQEASLAILIASASPVDQYLIKNPEYFWGSSPENAFIDNENPYILMDHMKCAAFEIPFEKGERFGTDETETLLDYLEESGVIRRSGDKWHWADRAYPSERISLRGGADTNVTIINTTKGKNEVIGEMDDHSARELIYDEAVYLHRGNQYQVVKLDLAQHVCRVKESDLNYYTDSLVKSDIKVLEVDCEENHDLWKYSLCDILVRNEVAKYKKLKFGTHENIGYGDIHLPEMEMHTRSLFLQIINPGDDFEGADHEVQAAVMSRISTLIRNTAPIFLLCRSHDIGVSGRVKDPFFDKPGVFVYDNFPGGIGLAEKLIECLDKVLDTALSLVNQCSCEQGCPSCLGPRDEKEMFEVNPKTCTRDFLARWLGR